MQAATGPWVHPPILPDDPKRLCLVELYFERTRTTTYYVMRYLRNNWQFQDRLKIERRAADDLQDLARGDLLLEGLGQIVISRLQFLEEADVLDGDDGLIGEGLCSKEIATHLRLTENTIQSHRKRIAAKLGTRGNELLHAAVAVRRPSFSRQRGK